MKHIIETLLMLLVLLFSIAAFASLVAGLAAMLNVEFVAASFLFLLGIVFGVSGQVCVQMLKANYYW